MPAMQIMTVKESVAGAGHHGRLFGLPATLVLCAVAGICFCGCASQAPERVEVEVPAGWEYGAAGPDAEAPAETWYREFGSDELDAFIKAAAIENLDIAAATAACCRRTHAAGPQARPCCHSSMRAPTSRDSAGAPTATH
jgi:hypothetical protein